MPTRYIKLIPANSPQAVATAFCCIGAATLMRVALEPVLGNSAPFITMFPATAVAAILGGVLSGILTAFLGALAAWYFLIPPTFTFNALSHADGSSLVFYLLGALLIVLVAATMRRTLVRLEDAQEKLYAALEASNTGTWRWDIQRDIVEWDPAKGKLFGLPPASWPRTAAGFLNLVHPDDREHVRGIIDRQISCGDSVEFEFRVLLPDGSERWIYDRSRTILDGDGRPLYMIGACLDITERKHAEERQTLLLHELNHRVKNTLATVQSLASQTLRSSHSLEGFEKAFMARLMALSSTHDVLTQTMWECALLNEILAAELRPHGGIDGQRIIARGETVRLKPQQVLSLGMAFHELATNAAKYGALSSPGGIIEVTWAAAAESNDRSLKILWRERGGPAVVAPERRGFGRRLIERSIAHELGGRLEMDFSPAGLECTIQVPLDAPHEAHRFCPAGRNALQ